MDGIGPKFLASGGYTADINSPYETFPPVRVCAPVIPRRIPRGFPARDLEHFYFVFESLPRACWATVL